MAKRKKKPTTKAGQALDAVWAEVNWKRVISAILISYFGYQQVDIKQTTADTKAAQDTIALKLDSTDQQVDSAVFKQEAVSQKTLMYRRRTDSLFKITDTKQNEIIQKLDILLNEQHGKHRQRDTTEGTGN